MLNINKKISSYNHYDYNDPKYIIIHYVGANSTAKNNVDYFYGGDRQASAHLFIDDNECWQSVEFNKGAWHIGNSVTTPNNTNSIGIEMCLVNGDVTAKTEANTIKVVKELMKKYGIPIENVRTHAEVTNYSKICPNWEANNWARWNKFKEQLKATYQPKTGYLNVKPFMKTWSIFKDDKYFDTWNRLVLLGCENGLSLKILDNPRKDVFFVRTRYGDGYAYAPDNNNTTVTDKPAFVVSEAEPVKEKGYEDFRWKATANGTEFANNVSSDELVKRVQHQLKWGYYDIKINRTDL